MVLKHKENWIIVKKFVKEQLTKDQDSTNQARSERTNEMFEKLDQYK